MFFKIFTHSQPSSHSTHTKNRFLVTPSSVLLLATTKMQNQALQPQLVVQVAGWMKESKTRRRNNRNKANRRKLREEEALIAEK